MTFSSWIILLSLMKEINQVTPLRKALSHFTVNTNCLYLLIVIVYSFLTRHTKILGEILNWPLLKLIDWCPPKKKFLQIVYCNANYVRKIDRGSHSVTKSSFHIFSMCVCIYICS